MSHKPSDIINEGVAEEHVMASKPVTVAPPTSPPVYRGDFESRGEHKDIIPRTFWVGIWDTAFFYAGRYSLCGTYRSDPA